MSDGDCFRVSEFTVDEVREGTKKREDDKNSSPPNSSYLNYGVIACQSMFLVFAGVLLAAIPQVARGTMEWRLIGFLLPFFPFVINCLCKPKDYFAAQRALVIWFCNSFVLFVTYIMDAKNCEDRIYGQLDYSLIWANSSGCNVFFYTISMLGFLISSVIFLCLLYALMNELPSCIPYFLALPAIYFSIKVMVPFSLVPTELFRSLRPLVPCIYSHSLWQLHRLTTVYGGFRYG